MNVLSDPVSPVKEIIELIIASYEKFFFNLKSYNYINFKKKADSMSLNF